MKPNNLDLRSRRLVFLDIDGVLNARSTFEALKQDGGVLSVCRWENMLDRVFVERLNRIVKATGADVVISSSWRITNKLHEIRRYLDAAGFQGSVIGETPRDFEGGGDVRGREIQAYLTEFRSRVEGPCGNFVILDDSCDMGALMPYLVRTNMETGLLDHHVVAAIHVLTADER